IGPTSQDHLAGRRELMSGEALIADDEEPQSDLPEASSLLRCAGVVLARAACEAKLCVQTMRSGRRQELPVVGRRNTSSPRPRLQPGEGAREGEGVAAVALPRVLDQTHHPLDRGVLVEPPVAGAEAQ